MKSGVDKAYEVLGGVVYGILKTILLLLLIPFFIVLICPIYLARVLVQLASKVWRPDLVTILRIRDTFYGIDDVTSCPKSSVAITLVLKGDFKKESLFKSLTRMLNTVRADGKGAKYPEFKRYLVKWMGFIFWKDEPEFEMEKHFEYIDPRINTLGFPGPTFLKELEKRLIQEPYAHQQSPWEFKILRNYRLVDYNHEPEINGNYPPGADEQYTAMIMKVHHSFIDGFSLLNVFLKGLIQVPDSAYMSKANFPKRNALETALLGIWLLFKTPYDTLSEILTNSDLNPWYLTKERITNDITSAICPRIPSQMIKDIAQEVNVSFTSVVTSAIAGGIRGMMIEQGKNPDDGGFSCLAPFPVPGRTETLGNYLSDCYVELPIEISDPVRRVQHVETQLQKLKYSTIPLSSFAAQPFFGGLFHWMLEPMVQFALLKSTGILSSFPGPTEEISWDGHPIADCYYSAGHDNPGIGIQFLAINYNGGWRLKIQADKGTLPTDGQVEKLVGYIMNEFHSYHKASVV